MKLKLIAITHHYVEKLLHNHLNLETCPWMCLSTNLNESTYHKNVCLTGKCADMWSGPTVGFFFETPATAVHLLQHGQYYWLCIVHCTMYFVHYVIVHCICKEYNYKLYIVHYTIVTLYFYTSNLNCKLYCVVYIVCIHTMYTTQYSIHCTRLTV